MRKFLLVLIVLVLVLFFALFKFEYVSSISPGWNSHANDSRFYMIVFLQNIIIPVILYFSTQRVLSLYVFLLYFFMVNIIFIVSESLVYDDITPGMGNENFQDYMTLQRFLIYGSLSIHLLFYLLFYFRLKEKEVKTIALTDL